MILSKSDLIYNIKNELTDNVSEAITPYHIRHNLLDVVDSVASILANEDVVAKNIATSETRSTRVGQFTLDRLKINNYTSIDNTALGYSSLKHTTTGERNTGLGSQSLISNVTGNDNIAIGSLSNYAVTTGSSNIGLGNYSLLGVRTGNHNIAIGHGAGYYIDTDSNYQFYLGTKNIDDDGICDDPEGHNTVPLMRGDLFNNKLGVNTKSLPNDAVIQTSGNISPVDDGSFDLGHSSYQWNNAYVQNLYLSPTDSINFSSSNNATFNFNLVPQSSTNVNIGSPTDRVNYIYSDTINTNTATFIYSNHYLNKTLNLASQSHGTTLDGGGPNSLYDYVLAEDSNASTPHLTDAELSGAGFKIYSTDSSRVYELTFVPSADNTTSCVDTSDLYGQSYWKSNISIELDTECYVKSNHIISSGVHDIKVAHSGDCQLLKVEHNNLVFADSSFASNNTLGYGFANFVCATGEFPAVMSVLREDAGDVRLRLLQSATGDNNPSMALTYDGFDIGLSSENILEFLTYNNSRTPKQIFTLNQNTTDGNVALFTDGDSDVNSAQASVHIETKEQDPSLLINSENNKSPQIQLRSNSSSARRSHSIQLNDTSLDTFVSFKSDTSSLGSTEDAYEDKEKAFSIRSDGFDLYSSVSGTQNFMVNIGDSLRTEASIGLRISQNNPTPDANYGAIFAKAKDNSNQVSALQYIDSSGNVFELSPSQTDGLVGMHGNNTFAGVETPLSADSATENNSGFGNNVLKSVTAGNRNTVIGSNSAQAITTGNNNLILGYNALTAATTNSHNIVIGNNIANSIGSDYNFVLGYDDSNILMQGSLGPTDSEKYLELPSNGNLIVQNQTNTESLSIKSNSLTFTDAGGSDNPDSEFSIKMAGNVSEDIVVFNHDKPALNFSPSYATSEVPFVEVKGNIRVKSNIQFSDGSSLNTGSFMSDVETAKTDSTSALSVVSSLLVEGTMNADLEKAASVNTPKIAQMTTLDGTTITIHNRDPKSSFTNGEYIIAIKINNEYRPIWSNNESNNLIC